MSDRWDNINAPAQIMGLPERANYRFGLRCMPALAFTGAVTLLLTIMLLIGYNQSPFADLHGLSFIIVFSILDIISLVVFLFFWLPEILRRLDSLAKNYFPVKTFYPQRRRAFNILLIIYLMVVLWICYIFIPPSDWLTRGMQALFFAFLNLLAVYAMFHPFIRAHSWRFLPAAEYYMMQQFFQEFFNQARFFRDNWENNSNGSSPQPLDRIAFAYTGAMASYRALCEFSEKLNNTLNGFPRSCVGSKLLGTKGDDWILDAIRFHVSQIAAYFSKSQPPPFRINRPEQRRRFSRFCENFASVLRNSIEQQPGFHNASGMEVPLSSIESSLAWLIINVHYDSD